MVGLLTTVNQTFERVAMHAVRTELVRAQAERAGLPLWVVQIPNPCSNDEYESAMRQAMEYAHREGIDAVASAISFLKMSVDTAKNRCADWDCAPLSALGSAHARAWPDHDCLRPESLRHVRDPKQIPAGFAGRPYDYDFLDMLPLSADPSASAANFTRSCRRLMSRPVAVRPGEVVARDGFVFADLAPA